MSYPEQRKRERKMARLNTQQRYAESLKLYLDARVPCREVWDAYHGLVKQARRLGQEVLPL